MILKPRNIHTPFLDMRQRLRGKIGLKPIVKGTIQPLKKKKKRLSLKFSLALLEGLVHQ
jgi:hypothetical protein